MRRVVVIGSKGQLGSDLVRELGDPDRIVPLSHQDLEICDHANTREVLTGLRPDAVINTAAYHRVDDCEDHESRAFETNAAAVLNLGRICNDLDALLVHVSTDYVFGGDGDRTSPYTEEDPPCPLNVYGASKLAGENLLREECRRHLIVRTSGLYGLAGERNFVAIMLGLAGKGRPIRVVDDQRLAPTYTAHVARKMVQLLASTARGTVHVTNQGKCTWHEFARRLFELTGLTPDLTPITSQEFGAKATRPAYSVLANEALTRAGLDPMPHWSQGLADYLAGKRSGR
jgi:dTDP-4-dehydrorhamnose reductase